MIDRERLENLMENVNESLKAFREASDPDDKRLTLDQLNYDINLARDYIWSIRKWKRES